MMAISQAPCLIWHCLPLPADQGLGASHSGARPDPTRDASDMSGALRG